MGRSMRILLVIALSLVMLATPVSVAAANGNSTYAPYTYTFDEEYTAILDAYAYTNKITAQESGAGRFSDLNDLVYVAATQTICVSDSGNNRVVFLDADGAYSGEIATFTGVDGEDTLSNPTGLFANDTYLYVADSGNHRILQFSLEDKSFVREFPRPVISLLDENYLYEPLRFVVTQAGKFYVIARNINQGLIELNADGEFVSFIGAPKVAVDLIDLLWRQIMSKEQREANTQNVPTEYSSVFLDKDGFFYVTSRSTNVSPIGRLNTQGVDVFRKSNFSKSGAVGDMLYTTEQGTTMKSTFTDIAVKDNGICYALDSTNGRIFCYSAEGDLLYVFGSSGSLDGLFQSPVSMELIGDDLYVVDQRKNCIYQFSQTPFGASIEKAVVLQKEGEYDAATAQWKDVLSRCSGYTFGKLSMVRILIYQKDYKTAMDQLDDIGEKTYYSRAFQQLRNQVISENFLLLLLGAAVLIAVLWLSIRLAKRYLLPKWRKSALFCEVGYAKHVLFHPIEGFWDLKNEKYGSLKAALILDAAAMVIYLLNTQFGGYLFSGESVWDTNLILLIARVAVPFLLWCVANWCFTTLMDGKGTFREIFVASSYALTPYVLWGVPLLLASRVLCYAEQNFYYVFMGIIVLWILILLFSSVMMTHDYSFGKTILTVLLTILGILLIVFICLLLVYLVQESFGFLGALFEEFMFRVSF